MAGGTAAVLRPRGQMLTMTEQELERLSFQDGAPSPYFSHKKEEPCVGFSPTVRVFVLHTLTGTA